MPTADDPAVQERRWSFGLAVRGRRTELGWSQEELATRAGWNRQSVVRLETATRSPSLDRLFVLADVLGMSLGQLAEAFERVDAPDDSGGSAEASAADAVRW